METPSNINININILLQKLTSNILTHQIAVFIQHMTSKTPV